MGKLIFSRNSFLFAVILFTFASFSFAQQPVIGRSTIKTADGHIFIQNGNVKSFTIEFKGKNVEAKTVGDNPAFVVDGKLVQVVIVTNSNFHNGPQNLNDEKMLELHRDWESDYLQKEAYAAKFDVESEKLSFGERKALFWGFKRPNANETYDRDYFLTTIVGAGLLGITSPIKQGESVADYKKLFLDILSTLKVTDKPIDVLKLADEIRESSKKVN